MWWLARGSLVLNAKDKPTEFVPVRFSFANLPNRVDPEALLQFMMDNSVGQRWFRMVPPPGRIRAAALDLLTVLYVGGAIASIASVFWMAYDKFIAPKRGAQSSGIYIAIGGPSGARVWLGSDVLEREEFINVFVAGVTSETGSGQDVELSDWQVEIQSGHWVEIKRER